MITFFVLFTHEKYQKCFYCGDLLIGRNSLLKLPDRNVAMLPDLLTLHAVFRRSIKTSYRLVYSPILFQIKTLLLYNSRFKTDIIFEQPVPLTSGKCQIGEISVKRNAV